MATLMFLVVSFGACAKKSPIPVETLKNEIESQIHGTVLKFEFVINEYQEYDSALVLLAACINNQVVSVMLYISPKGLKVKNIDPLPNTSCDLPKPGETEGNVPF